MYCYLISDTDKSPHWPKQRHEMRRQFLCDGRRMSFKSLGDRIRRRALVPFLETAETIEGHLVALVVTKKLSNMSIRAGWSTELPRTLGLQGTWKHSSFEQMFRSAHMLALCLSLWSRPWMDVTWITDQDEIVANDGRLDDAHQIAARLVSRYLTHRMGIFAMNSTAIDGKERAFEDFVAIADLAAGMLSEIAGKLAVDARIPAIRIEKSASDLSEKSKSTSSSGLGSSSGFSRFDVCMFIAIRLISATFVIVRTMH